MGFTKITNTSEDIINYLKGRQFELTGDDKEFIRKRIRVAITDAAEWKSNGCDCGQVVCPVCGG